MNHRTFVSKNAISKGALCAALSAVISATPAYAQDSADQEASDGSPGLDVIIVTANKREESVQDVPTSISAVSGDYLAKSGVFEVAAIQQASPGVFINPTGNTTQTIVRIRGIGTSGTNNGFESAVGIFVDGVFRPRAGQALGNLIDVQRVEVLRGPQGTLFGKNTSAGAISIITNEPEFDFGASFSAGFGNSNSRRFEGHVTGGITDNLAIRVAGVNHDRDGTVDKLFPDTGAVPRRDNNFYNNRDRGAIKGQLLWEPDDDSSIKLIADYSKINEIGNVGVTLTTSPAGLLGIASGVLGIPQGTPSGSLGIGDLSGFVPADFNINARETQQNSDPFERTEDGGVTLVMKWDFGLGELTSITAWRDYSTERSFDLDQTGADILQPLDETGDIETLTQEIQLAGSDGGFDWLVGAYLFDEDIRFFTPITLGTEFSQYVGLGLPIGAFTGTGLFQDGSQTNKGFSIFTQNSYYVTDRLQVTGGLRFNHSRKRGISILNGAAPGTPSVSAAFCPLIGEALLQSLCFNRSIDVARTENEWTGTAKVKYDFSDDINAYASYSRGYKAGGINLDRESLDDTNGVITDLTEFAPEFVDAYEIGLKTQLFDNRLRFNLAAYYSDFSGFQLNSFNGVSFTVINVEEVVAKGIEVDAVLAVTDGVTINGSVAYNEAEFANDLGPNPLAAPFEGLTLPSAPRWQIAAGLDVDREIPGLGLRGVLTANYSYLSSYNAGSQGDPTQQAPGYSLINASIGVRTLDDRFGVRLSGTNLANITRSVFINPTIFQPGGRSSYLNEPRFYSLTFDLKF